MNLSKPPNAALIASATLPVGAPPAFGAIHFQNMLWFQWPPPLLRTAVRMSSGMLLMPRQRSSTLLPCRSGCFCKRGVQIGDVRLMMLPVMNLHRLRVDVRLERGVVIRERGKFVGHSSSVGAGHRTHPNRTMVLHDLKVRLKLDAMAVSYGHETCARAGAGRSGEDRGGHTRSVRERQRAQAFRDVGRGLAGGEVLLEVTVNRTGAVSGIKPLRETAIVYRADDSGRQELALQAVRKGDPGGATEAWRAS